jgi:uncharacterized membrane protein YcaP (DUF421 family)
MTDLWIPTEPWWAFIARAAIIYLALLVLVRMSGKRTVGQFTPFDLIVLLILSEGVQNALVVNDHSITGALIVVATLLALNYLLGFATARSRRIEQFVEGRPVLLARDGRIFHDVLRAMNISDADFREAMRKNDCVHEDRIGFAFLETNGGLSVIKREDQHAH